MDATRDEVDVFGRDESGVVTRDIRGTGVARGCSEDAAIVGLCLSWSVVVRPPVYTEPNTGVFISDGSDDGGSEPGLGFNGVRNGDLNGLWSVFAASFSLRRLACGVDILAAIQALGNDRFCKMWNSSDVVE